MAFTRAGIAGVVFALAAALAAPSAPAAAATSPAATVTPQWLVSRGAIDRIAAYLGNTTLTTNAFDTATTLESGTPATGWAVQRTVMFDAYGPATSTTSLLYALANHTIPAGTVYVGYDDESWSFTPTNEQQDPATYMAAFVSAAHQNGYEAILDPAVDLTTVMPCYTSTQPAWQLYLTTCDIPALVAKAGPDVYEIQSQRFENDTTSGSSCGCYQWFTTQASSEATAQATIPVILGGLSTNPAGASTTAQTLYTDTLNTIGSVAGYSMNVPVQAPSCPSCSPTGAPDVAAGYLWLLGYTGQGSQSITFTSQAPTSAVYGGPAYTVTATGGPSGNPVSFSSGSPTVCALSGSTVSFVGAGTCVVDADQAGSTDWASAPEATQTFPVAPASQAITFSAPASGTVGGSATLSATGGPSGNPVTFSLDPSSVAGVCGLSGPNGAVVEYTAVGSCVVDANQAGSADYAPAPAVARTIPVGQGSQTIDFTAPASGAVGESTTLTATGGGSGNPVVFSLDPSSGAGVCALSGPDGSTLTFSGTGSCVIDANQAGDANWAPAPPVMRTVSVGPGSQTITFSSSPPAAATYAGPTYTVSATGGASGNPVTFSSATPAICTVTGATVSFVGVGTCTVLADQAGSSDYSAAPEVSQSFAVAKAAQTVTFTSKPPANAVVGKATYTVAARGGGSGNPVTFSSATPAVCKVSGSTVSFVGAGTCTVLANQAGSTDYSPAPQVAQSFKVKGR